MYSDESINKFTHEHAELTMRLEETKGRVLELGKEHSDEKVREYMCHGIYRRLATLERCVENVMRIFPLSTSVPLENLQRMDVTINLHAFITNSFGVMDNVAWVNKHASNANLRKFDVGLFQKRSKKYFSKSFSTFLSNEVEDWHSMQIELRDSLAHRVPVYLPPCKIDPDIEEQYRELDEKITHLSFNCPKRDKSAALQIQNQVVDEHIAQIDNLRDKQKELERPAFYVTHSYSESEGKYWPLHVMILVDLITIEKIVSEYCDAFEGISELPE